MERRWDIAAFDAGYVRPFAQQLGVSALVAEVLWARGIQTVEAAQKFLARKLGDLHDPERLPGVPEAADRVVAAVSAGRRITIYGDYDVDGVTSTSLLWHCLRLAGATVDYYIPSRLEEGYGLNCEAIRNFHAADPDQLVVSVDCGITSVKEAALAKELGLELIITDHHNFGETLPADTVLVHPRLPGGDYPFGELCGVGVAFKLAWAICARLGDGKKASPRMREFLLGAIGLTAIGTVADVVPLVDENRVLVHFGIASLLDRANPGMKALLGVAKLLEKPHLQSEDIGYAIAPRINAAGRLGQARLAVELLTTDNADRAQMLATHLDQLNKDRQTAERKMLKQAKELVAEHPEWLEQRSLVLSHPEWHAGVIGIVAGRVAEHFQRPAVMIAVNNQSQSGQGSGRSYAGFDLYGGVSTCRDLLQTFGGHHAAVGLKIHADAIDSFRQRFHEHVATCATLEPGQGTLRIDGEISFRDLTRNAVKEIDRLGPFGCENRRPVFMATQVTLAAPPKKMGEGERHLSLLVRQFGQSFRAIAFGKAEWADPLAELDKPFSIAFQPIINHFRGQENVELQLMDWQP